MDEEVRVMLAKEMVYLKNLSWPTCDIDAIRSYNGVDITKAFKKYVLVNGYDDFQHEHKTVVVNPEENLLKSFKDVKYIVSKYPVIAAGGAVFKSLFNINQYSDIDLFFYGNISEAVARATLDEILQYFQEKYESVMFERNQNVTNVIIGDDEGDYKKTVKYQFVHRVFPTKISIIGAFDLNCSSVYYDGEYYTTPLGAFCVGTKLNIFNYYRTSPSYEYRIRKYSGYYCSTLLTNTSISAIAKVVGNSNHSDEIFYTKSTRLSVYPVRDAKRRTVGYAARFCYRNKPTNDDDNVIVGDYGAVTSSKFKISNARVAASGRADCVIWRSATVEGLSNAKIEYEVDKKILCNTKNEHIMTLAEAAPLLQFLDPAIKNQKLIQLLKNGANKWIGPEALPGLAEQVVRYLSCTATNDIYSRAGLNIQVNSKDLLREINRQYTDIITNRIVPVIAKAKADALAQNGTWAIAMSRRKWSASMLPHTDIPIREFFMQNIYEPLLLGIPENIETLLRLFVRNKVGPWSYIPKDVLTIIIEKLICSI